VPADPPVLHAAVPDWKPGDEIFLGARTLRVVGTRTGLGNVVAVGFGG
jgi:hypothetical protein